MEKIFAVLGSDVRQQILVYLSSDRLTFKQLADRFPFTGPALVYHLRMLQEAGLIENRKQGRSSYYYVLSENVERALTVFAAGSSSTTTTGAQGEDATLRGA